MGKSKKKHQQQQQREPQPAQAEKPSSGWQAITLTKKKKKNPAQTRTNLEPNSGPNASANSSNTYLLTPSSSTTPSAYRSAAGTGAHSSPAPPGKTHKLPNFKGQLRALAASVDPNAQLQPGKQFKKIASIYAYKPIEGQEARGLTKVSCKLMLTELGLFRPPRNYITLGGFEIVWAKTGHNAKTLSLERFKADLVPALAQAIKPRPQSTEELWSRLCLDASLLISNMRPKNKQQSHQQPRDDHEDYTPQPVTARTSVGTVNSKGRLKNGVPSFAAKAKKTKAKPKKMSIQEFQAQKRNERRAAEVNALAATRNRAHEGASQAQVSESLREIMEREARLKEHQLKQERAESARAKAAAKAAVIAGPAYKQPLGMRPGRRSGKQVWATPSADAGNLRAVMAREALMKQQQQKNHSSSGSAGRSQQRSAPAGRWGSAPAAGRGQPSLREIQSLEQEQRRKQLEQRQAGGAQQVAGAWQFEDGVDPDAAGEFDDEEYELEAQDEVVPEEVVDERGFWDFDD